MRSASTWPSIGNENLECNDLLKGKYQEKILVDFCNYLTSDEHIQLKSSAHGLIPVFGSNYMKKYFQIRNM